jgi:LytS/YehU family sensor histidine kinase
MLLQPVVENAYSHGLSRLDKDGMISIDAWREHDALTIRVINSGRGLHYPESFDGGTRKGVGLMNVKDRLRLHYGNDQAFSIEEIAQGKVQVTLTFPLQFSEQSTRQLTGYGVS